MAQSDWLILSGNNYLLGGADGFPKLHAVLANAITSSGTYCRVFQLTQGGSSNFRTTSRLIPTSLTSSYFPTEKAYSLRTWVHMSGSSPGIAALVFKGDTGLGSFGGDIYSVRNNYTWGYMLSLEHSTLVLRCANPIHGVGYFGVISGSGNNDAYEDPNIITLPLNTWHRLRMDITPVGELYDKIDIYTGSQADTWSQIYTANIQATKLSAYIPWGVSGSGYGTLGYVVTAADINSGVCIDKFECYIQDV